MFVSKNWVSRNFSMTSLSRTLHMLSYKPCSYFESKFHSQLKFDCDVNRNSELKRTGNHKATQLALLWQTYIKLPLSHSFYTEFKFYRRRLSFSERQKVFSALWSVMVSCDCMTSWTADISLESVQGCLYFVGWQVVVIVNLLAPELFFLISAHPVYKMWITQEPNKLALWTKLHFEEKKNGEYRACLKYSVPIFVE